MFYLSVPVNATAMVLLVTYLNFEYDKRTSFLETLSFILATTFNDDCYHK